VTWLHRLYRDGRKEEKGKNEEMKENSQLIFHRDFLSLSLKLTEDIFNLKKCSTLSKTRITERKTFVIHLFLSHSHSLCECVAQWGNIQGWWKKNLSTIKWKFCVVHFYVDITDECGSFLCCKRTYIYIWVCPYNFIQIHFVSSSFMLLSSPSHSQFTNYLLFL
jgi:hypothetical protein